MPLEFVASVRGNPKLIDSGYYYTKDRAYGDTTSWECDCRRIIRCRARIRTNRECVIARVGHHNHAAADRHLLRRKPRQTPVIKNNTPRMEVSKTVLMQSSTYGNTHINNAPIMDPLAAAQCLINESEQHLRRLGFTDALLRTSAPAPTTRHESSFWDSPTTSVSACKAPLILQPTGTTTSSLLPGNQLTDHQSLSDVDCGRRGNASFVRESVAASMSDSGLPFRSTGTRTTSSLLSGHLNEHPPVSGEQERPVFQEHGLSKKRKMDPDYSQLQHTRTLNDIGSCLDVAFEQPENVNPVIATGQTERARLVLNPPAAHTMPAREAAQPKSLARKNILEFSGRAYQQQQQRYLQYQVERSALTNHSAFSSAMEGSGSGPSSQQIDELLPHQHILPDSNPSVPLSTPAVNLPFAPSRSQCRPDGSLTNGYNYGQQPRHQHKKQSDGNGASGDSCGIDGMRPSRPVNKHGSSKAAKGPGAPSLPPGAVTLDAIDGLLGRWFGILMDKFERHDKTLCALVELLQMTSLTGADGIGDDYAAGDQTTDDQMKNTTSTMTGMSDTESGEMAATDIEFGFPSPSYELSESTTEEAASGFRSSAQEHGDAGPDTVHDGDAGDVNESTGDETVDVKPDRLLLDRLDAETCEVDMNPNPGVVPHHGGGDGQNVTSTGSSDVEGCDRFTGSIGECVWTSGSVDQSNTDEQWGQNSNSVPTTINRDREHSHSTDTSSSLKSGVGDYRQYFRNDESPYRPLGGMPAVTDVVTTHDSGPNMCQIPCAAIMEPAVSGGIWAARDGIPTQTGTAQYTLERPKSEGAADHHSEGVEGEGSTLPEDSEGRVDAVESRLGVTGRNHVVEQAPGTTQEFSSLTVDMTENELMQYLAPFNETEARCRICTKLVPLLQHCRTPTQPNANPPLLHVLAHFEGPMACCHCDETFRMGAEFRRHLATQHGIA